MTVLRRQPHGFGMIEFLLVIAIVGILFWMAPNYMASLERNKRVRAASEVQTIANNVYGRDLEDHGFVGDIGLVPVDLETNLSSPVGYALAGRVWDVTHGWHGPYANPAGQFRDPWGSPWRILADGRIASNGADRLAGTADDVIAPEFSPIINGVLGDLAVEVIDAATGLQLDDTTVVVTAQGADPASPGDLRNVAGAFQASGWFQFADVAPSVHILEAVGIAGTPFEGFRGHGKARVRPGARAVVQLHLNYAGG